MGRVWQKGNLGEASPRAHLLGTEIEIHHPSPLLFEVSVYVATSRDSLRDFTLLRCAVIPSLFGPGLNGSHLLILSVSSHPLP